MNKDIKTRRPNTRMPFSQIQTGVKILYGNGGS